MTHDSETPQTPGARTQAVHGVEHEPGPLGTPIVHSATYSFPSLDAMNAEQDRGAAGAYYHRLGHPTLHAVEKRLAALDGAEEALLFSSGVAAIASVFLAHLSAGDRLVLLQQCYGGTHALAEWGASRFGWSVERVDARDPASWERVVRRGTKILHVESPTNPTLHVVDLERAARLAHAAGALLSLDNTFASPLGQRAHGLGADLVSYSATKSIGGHSDLLAGVVTGAKEHMTEVWRARKIFGPVPDAEVAWRIERSLKTLPLRVEAANATALELARRLSKHSSVAQVLYPGLPGHAGHDVARRQMALGFGPVLAVEITGGSGAAERVANALRLVRHAPSLGSVESLVSLPAHTSHIQLGPEGRRAAGIPEELIRMSVGIEDVQDLWRDLEQALAKAAVVPA